VRGEARSLVDVESFVDVLGGETDETEMMLVATRRKVGKEAARCWLCKSYSGFVGW
jgi:hypothetical protein